jgi:hypothetical protein
MKSAKRQGFFEPALWAVYEAFCGIIQPRQGVGKIA